MDNIIVIGSGPAGVSAALGLLERGCKVLMLDAGNTLEPEKKKLLQAMQNDINIETQSLRHHANGKKNLKLPYGSNFIYQDVNNYFSWQTENCHFQPSFAQGGLSNVWGGAIAEHSIKELSHWPIVSRDLSAYYAKVQALFGSYYYTNSSYTLSRQARHLHSQWQQQHNTLTKNGFSFSTATLAVKFNDCRFCGSCQYGCPYHIIYNSAMSLDQLKQHDNFSYLDNIIVENFIENHSSVSVFALNIKTQQKEQFHAQRLFVASGSGLSSLLYLRSLNQPGKKLYLKDSQHFVLPCLLNKRFRGITQDKLHTLCQLNLTLSDDKTSSYPVQMQLYTYMDFYQQEIKNTLKWVYPILQPVLTFFLERLIVIQGYFDSRDSGYLAIEYQQSGNFLISATTNTSVKKKIKSLVKILKQRRKTLAFKPLPYLLTQSLTGQSNHVGGSLPMSDHPEGDEVDIWGTPKYYTRIHFVDGSILPSLPAGPITTTIMANAYRISKECPL